MNLQKNMEAIFFVAAITTVTALWAAPTPEEPVKYTENIIATEIKPALIVIHGQRPSLGEKLAYRVNNALEYISLAVN